MANLSLAKKYGYLWITLAFFIFSLAGHWLFAWPVYKEEQRAHNEPVEIKGFFLQTARDTLENWQSEFLQLIWQVGGLTFLLFIGSPQSKEGDERLEKKVDHLITLLDPEKGKGKIHTLEKAYPKQ